MSGPEMGSEATEQAPAEADLVEGVERSDPGLDLADRSPGPVHRSLRLQCFPL